MKAHIGVDADAGLTPSLTKSCLFRSFLTCRASETRVVVRGGWAKQNVVP